MSDVAIRVDHVSKEYRLGMIGGTTLRADLQRLWAKMRGKGDPNAKIGTDQMRVGDRFLALDDVSFEVKKGEALGIIGHNGAGKSTLLKLLARVTAPTKGTISYNGRIASMLEVGTGFHGELTGRENIYMNGAILGMRKAEIDRKLDEIVAFAEMEKFIDTPVKRYSSGMYVKLAFAVAAHLDAEIMIMDEVLAVGDMKFQQKCLGRMNDAAHNEGRTVLFVSHNMGAVRRLCNSAILLNQGKVLLQSKVNDCIKQYMQYSARNVDRPLEQMSRKGNGKVKILKIRLINEFSETDTVEGSALGFEIQYQCLEDCDGKVYLSIVDNFNNRLMFFDSFASGFEPRFLFGRGAFRVNLDDAVSLTEGKYYINIAIFSDGDMADYIQHGFSFNILKGDLTKNGRCPVDKGLIYINQNWQMKM